MNAQPRPATPLPVKTDARSLRLKAEQRFADRETAGQEPSPEEARSLLHELGVHQAELEMQNDELRRTRGELEAATKEMEAFSYSVSHDLRAPLRAIEGFSAIIVRDHLEQLDPEVQRLVGLVRSNILRMSDLIDGLLRFSRASRLEMKSAPIDMTNMVKELLGEVVPDERWDRFEARAEELPPATGDPELIRVVLQNLLSNAVKFSGKRERAVIEVGSRPGPEGPEYFVKDNGAGFDMAYADQLFGVFHRLHGETEFEGTGIGLALVKRIVVRHGGQVRAEGSLGRGAIFSFSLPVVGNGLRTARRP